MKLEQFLYSPFGNNLVIGRHIKEQLDFLKKIVPEEFQGREMYDLGCGDGKITELLREIFKPTEAFGCDLGDRLAKRAKKRGIETRVVDLEKDVPKGDLAVMWGVLHHLKNQDEILKKIKNNFKHFFLREPLSEKKSFLELGEPFKKEELEGKIKKILGDYKIFIHKNAVFIFWKRI